MEPQHPHRQRHRGKDPTEILSAEDSAVEFLHAEDGSVSLLIKNVIL